MRSDADTIPGEIKGPSPPLPNANSFASSIAKGSSPRIPVRSVGPGVAELGLLLGASLRSATERLARCACSCRYAQKKMVLINPTENRLHSFATGSRFMGSALRFESMQSHCLSHRIGTVTSYRRHAKGRLTCLATQRMSQQELGGGKSSVSA